MTTGKAFDDSLAERDALRAQVQRLQEQLLVETEQREKFQDQRDRLLLDIQRLTGTKGADSGKGDN